MLPRIFGGVGGCAVIGQTMINVKASRARIRISTFCAGIFLFLLVVVFGDFVGTIPMAALVAVMIMVAVGAFDWHSVRPSTLKRMWVSSHPTFGESAQGKRGAFLRRRVGDTASL